MFTNRSKVSNTFSPLPTEPKWQYAASNFISKVAPLLQVFVKLQPILSVRAFFLFLCR